MLCDYWGRVFGGLRVVVVIVCVIAATGCDSGQSQPYGAYEPQPPPPPPPTRICTAAEQQLISGVMAQKYFDTDKCIVLKKSVDAQLSACEFENQTSLITAAGSITIHDDLTPDTFDLETSGIFTANGEPLQLSTTSISTAYEQACNRTGVMGAVAVVACVANAQCRESNN